MVSFVGMKDLIKKKKVHKYKVKWNKETKQIEVSTKKETKSFIFENFICGTGSYLEETMKYPIYVHGLVWKIFEEINK